MSSPGPGSFPGFERHLLTDTHERRYLESRCNQCGSVILAGALTVLHQREAHHLAECQAQLAQPATMKAKAKVAAA